MSGWLTGIFGSDPSITDYTGDGGGVDPTDPTLNNLPQQTMPSGGSQIDTGLQTQLQNSPAVQGWGTSAMPNMVQNSDGTWTDTTNGAVYDANGIATGATSTDANYSGTAGAGIAGAGGLGSLLQSLGLGSGAAGLAGLAGILAPLAGGLYSANKTNQATQQVLGGINNANTAIKGILGAPSVYAPYTGAGQTAISKLNGMNFQPMNFAPLGTPGAYSPSGLTLGNLASTSKKG